jgi:hypothetical protein
VTTPPPAPVPVPEGGPLAHFEAWAAKHIAPDLADIKAKAEGALAGIQKAAPVLEKVAALLEKSVRAGTLPAELVTEAEAVAREAAEVAGDLAAAGL